MVGSQGVARLPAKQTRDVERNITLHGVQCMHVYVSVFIFS